MTNAGDESRLGYAALARAAFAFLEAWGFALVQSDGTLLRYESPRVWLNLYHARGSYMLGGEFGPAGSERYWTLGEVLKAFCPEMLERLGGALQDRESLARGLELLASTLRERCAPLFVGEPEAWEKLEAVAQRLREKLTFEAQYGGHIVMGDQAWDAGDFDRAASFYTKAAPALDETRKLRLRRAQRMKKPNQA